MAEHVMTNVGALITRLRGMLGHVRKRDRETVSQAIDAIGELAQRLHEATRFATELDQRLDAARTARAQPLGAYGSKASVSGLTITRIEEP